MNEIVFFHFISRDMNQEKKLEAQQEKLQRQKHKLYDKMRMFHNQVPGDESYHKTRKYKLKPQYTTQHTHTQ